jgi:putative Mg2+ transporter-C (MgtC) family protein
MIVFSQGKVRGLTTGAGLWLAAAVGLSAGFGFWMMATATTILSLVVIRLVKVAERKTMHGKQTETGFEPGDGSEE